MPKIQKILVPYDFSEISLRALSRGAALCRKWDAKLLVLHVVESSNDEILKYLALPQDYQASLKKKIQGEIQKIAHETGEKKISHEIFISRGKPAVRILKIAEEEKADLIVMGTQGRTGLKHVFLGSVAERVVRYSSVPVWVNRGAPDLPKKILIPVDFSENNRMAFEMALDWVEFLGAEVYLLHVVDLRDLYTFEVLSLPVDHPSLEKTLKSEAEEKLAQWGKKVPRPHLLEVKVGNPVLEIHDAIRLHSIDLVMMATHGRTGLKHLLLGSVAENVVRTSPVSVVTVRPPAFQQSALKIFEDEASLEEYTKSFRT
jgi:nucleotide-binding universal stress UspA family protein